MRRVAMVLATVGLIAVGVTATPARAHDGWWGYPEWRESGWRARLWGSGSARLRSARRSVRRRTRTTTRITTPTGTPTRRQPTILRRLTILRAAVGTLITGAITRAERGCQSIRCHGVRP